MAAKVERDIFYLDLFKSAEFIQALRFTLLQAFLSALGSVAMGLILAPGYSQFTRGKKWLRILLIFPQIVSPVMTVLCLLLFFPQYPFGLWGVVLGHVFINAGLCTLILGERWEVIEKDFGKLSGFLGAEKPFFI